MSYTVFRYYKRAAGTKGTQETLHRVGTRHQMINYNPKRIPNLIFSFFVFGQLRRKSLWEASSRIAGQENPVLLWNPEIYYLVHNSFTLVHITKHMNLVHSLNPTG